MAVDGKVKVTEGTAKKSLGDMFRAIKAEFKRITWPGKKDIKKAAIAASVFCVAYVIYVGALDAVFQNLFDLIFRIK